MQSILFKKEKKSMRLSIETRVDVCEDEKCSSVSLPKLFRVFPNSFPNVSKTRWRQVETNFFQKTLREKEKPLVYFACQNLFSRSSHHFLQHVKRLGLQYALHVSRFNEREVCMGES